MKQNKANRKLNFTSREYRETLKLLHGMPRSKWQLNKYYQSDCEILKLPHGYLCLTTDSIGEEIDLGLYQSPELWAWMTVMSSVSDLAASGSKPLGLLLANQWKYNTSRLTKSGFMKGAKKALRLAQLPLLGGDSGNGESHCHTSTAVGISPEMPLQRTGIKEGDVICILGRNKTGFGPSLALRILFGLKPSAFHEKHFRPTPSVRKMEKLRKYLVASIDTSDGIATSLQTLAELNKVGFEIFWDPETLAPEARKFVSENRIHPLMLWLNDLGDLQTLVAISPRNLQRALKSEKELVPIAKAHKSSFGLQIQYENKWMPFPADKITNCPRDISKLKKAMRELNLWLWKNAP